MVVRKDWTGAQTFRCLAQDCGLVWAGNDVAALERTIKTHKDNTGHVVALAMEASK